MCWVSFRERSAGVRSAMERGLFDKYQDCHVLARGFDWLGFCVWTCPDWGRDG